MDPVFIRVRRGDEVATYPLAHFGSLEHNSRSQIYANVGTYLLRVIVCQDEEECLLVEAAILNRIARALRASPDASPSARIIDINEIAAEYLQDLRDAEAEAGDMARIDAMLVARERDRETAYDGARADHSDLELGGGV